MRDEGGEGDGGGKRGGLMGGEEIKEGRRRRKEEEEGLESEERREERIREKGEEREEGEGRQGGYSMIEDRACRTPVYCCTHCPPGQAYARTGQKHSTILNLGFSHDFLSQNHRIPVSRFVARVR